MRLALKIPPPIILAIATVVMSVLAKLLPVGLLDAPFWLPILVALAGIYIAILGVQEFRRAKTTLNPLSPNQTNQIVQSGIFTKTRNPMYLGMALVLCAWALWLGAVITWLGVAMFVVYITYFQIIPEEQILSKKFGDDFVAYYQKVRRWL